MKNINKITGTAIFASLIIVFQTIANFVPANITLNISLSLFPIALGAIVYGPFVGFILGIVAGIMALIAPLTISVFFVNFPIQTILVCLLKTSIAGLLAGYTYKLIQKYNKNIAIIISSILVPIVNTGIFAIAMLTIFRTMLDETYVNSGSSDNLIYFLFFVYIGANFILEIIINGLLSPTMIKLSSFIKK